MSITSVGHINPNAIVGGVSPQAKAREASEQSSPASPQPKADSFQSRLSGRGAPIFATDTQAALLTTQERATYWANYKVPFAAET